MCVCVAVLKEKECVCERESVTKELRWRERFRGLDKRNTYVQCSRIYNCASHIVPGPPDGLVTSLDD